MTRKVDLIGETVRYRGQNFVSLVLPNLSPHVELPNTNSADPRIWSQAARKSDTRERAAVWFNANLSREYDRLEKQAVPRIVAGSNESYVHDKSLLMISHKQKSDLRVDGGRAGHDELLAIRPRCVTFIAKFDKEHMFVSSRTGMMVVKGGVGGGEQRLRAWCGGDPEQEESPSSDLENGMDMAVTAFWQEPTTRVRAHDHDGSEDAADGLEDGAEAIISVCVSGVMGTKSGRRRGASLSGLNIAVPPIFGQREDIEGPQDRRELWNATTRVRAHATRETVRKAQLGGCRGWPRRGAEAAGAQRVRFWCGGHQEREEESHLSGLDIVVSRRVLCCGSNLAGGWCLSASYFSRWRIWDMEADQGAGGGENGTCQDKRSRRVGGKAQKATTATTITSAACSRAAVACRGFRGRRVRLALYLDFADEYSESLRRRVVACFEGRLSWFQWLWCLMAGCRQTAENSRPDPGR
ncbi:hypothetical protein C8J57DRAFT_1470436 [Mycena rebaudengoi]|nr:hypothetical protein C8J57DRAFT_1470436 [Mycena rebaudengoi]